MFVQSIVNILAMIRYNESYVHV